MSFNKQELIELLDKAKQAIQGKWEDHNWDIMERPHVVAHSLWNYDAPLLIVDRSMSVSLVFRSRSNT